MAFEAAINTREALTLTREILRKIPFVWSNALNDTAIAFQEEQRAHQRSVFTIRRKTWWKRAVKIKPFAKAKEGKLFTTISIDPPGQAQSWVDIFERHEEGGKRHPRLGGRHLAIPRDVPKTGSDIVRKPWRPRRAIAQKGAFILELSGGRALILRRNTKRGRGRSKFVPGHKKGAGRDPNLEVLYFLTPDADIDAVYEFLDNAERIWKTVFPRRVDHHWVKEIEQAAERRVARRTGGGSSSRGLFGRIFG